MKTSVAVSVVCLCNVMMLAGCGEKIASETQKAVAQIKVEAEKLATQKMEAFRTEALGQLKKLGGEKPNEKASQAKPDEPSLEKPVKVADDKGASASR
jgi:hypothetical protein